MICTPRDRAGQNDRCMESVNTERSSSGSAAVAAELASINAQLTNVATKSDILKIEKTIETLKGDMNNTVHKVASEKVRDAMTKRHETCQLEFKNVISMAIEEHVKALHPRTSQSPQQKAFWTPARIEFAKLIGVVIAAALAAIFGVKVV